MINQSIERDVGLMSISVIIGFFSPIHVLLLCAIGFILTNFVCNILLSIDKCIRRKKMIKLKNLQLRATLFNLIFALITIASSWVLGLYVLPFEDYAFEKVATGIICSIEFLGILKKASFLTNKKAYVLISKYLKTKQPIINI